MSVRKCQFQTIVAVLAVIVFVLTLAFYTLPEAIALGQAGKIEWLSVAPDGSPGNASSYMQSPIALSADGRYALFDSDANNLVNGDTNGKLDVFVYDRITKTKERVSISGTGAQGNDYSWSGSISADGRYIAFSGNASNLVEGDTNGATDVFVHDRVTGQTERVSVSSSGGQASGDPGAASSYGPAISADGRFVAFESGAANLVDGDTNQATDIFVHDRVTGLTERVSVSNNGAQADNYSYSGTATISADGRYIAFSSDAGNLVDSDTNQANDIFVHDRVTGLTERVNVTNNGTQADNYTGTATISADGRYVAFYSYAENLVEGDANGNSDVFVHDRVAHTTERVSISTTGVGGDGASFMPSISADGRYIAFYGYAGNLVEGDTNGDSDIFVHDRETHTTERVSLSQDGAEGNGFSEYPSISPNGRFVLFQSYASNLVAGDTNGGYDVFLYDRNLGPSVNIGNFKVAGNNGLGVQVSGLSGAVDTAGAIIKAYPWSDQNSNGTVEEEELGTAIVLGTSANDGSLAAAGLGDLGPGNFKYVMTATDASGQESAKDTATVLMVETISPTLVVNNPTDNLLTGSSFVIVAGTAEVGSEVTVNGVKVDTDLLGNFARVLDLSPGNNNITVTAKDAAWNTTSLTRQVFYDNVFPTLEVTAPADQLKTRMSTVTVTGNAETGSLVQVNGEIVIPDAGGNFGKDVALINGSNFITVTATDAAGNTTSVTRTVIYDLIPPSLSVSSPGDNLITNQGQITVSGQAEAGAVVTVNGEDAAPGVGGSFSKTVNLVTGGNTITVTAVDALQNTSTVKRTVFYDNIPPILEFTPADNFVTNKQFLIISGYTEANGTVTVNGKAVIPDFIGNFSDIINLSPGSNSITVVAIDAAGNVTTVSRNVVFNSVFAQPGTTEIVSLTSDEEQVEAGLTFSISADGRYVAFASSDSKLRGALTGAGIFVRDRVAGQTEQISISSTGEPSGGGSGNPSISADGRYVAFMSGATNLVSDDTNGYSDIFVHDRVTHTTERVNLSSSGEQAVEEYSSTPAISADGRYVVFQSGATNLVSGDTNGYVDIFVHDRVTHTTERVNVSGTGEQSTAQSVGYAPAITPAISGDGRFVAFPSSDGNLVPGDNNGNLDIFVHDRTAHTTERVSVSSSGEQAQNQEAPHWGWSTRPAISADGRYVAFVSGANNLVTGDSNNSLDVFVHDRVTHTTDRVNVTNSGEQSSGLIPNSPISISSDGRYVAFETDADDLIPGDTNNCSDIFVSDRWAGQIKIASISGSGAQADDWSQIPFISGDGNHVAFTSWMPHLVENDSNGWGADIYVRTYQAETDNTPPSVNTRRFTYIDNPGGAQDKIAGSPGAVDEDLATVKAYPWSDGNNNGVVDPGELDNAVPLGTSNSDGSVDPADAGDREPGVYSFVITATDAADNESPKDAAHAFIADLLPPNLILTTPEDNLLTGTGWVMVTGTAEAGSTVKVNGVTVDNFTGNFAKVVNLEIGSNTITVTASDAAGNTTTITRRVTYLSPYLNVTSPPDNLLTNVNKVTVAGTVEEGTKVTVNGIVIPTGSGGNFSTEFTLSAGSNTLTITASDPAGNTTTVTRTVIYDNVPPTIKITFPANNYTTTKHSVTLAGTAEPGSTVTVNGAWVNNMNQKGDFNSVVNLSDGSNTISVTATDAAGNSASLGVTVVVENGFSNPHGEYMSSDAYCALCHRFHQADGQKLLNADLEKKLCYSCHDGSQSKYDVRAAFGEGTLGTSTMASRHKVPDGTQYCTDCHNPHLSPGERPRLLEAGASEASSGIAFCGSCHGAGSNLPGGNIVANYTGSPHESNLSASRSPSLVQCLYCHEEHASPIEILLRTVVPDLKGGQITVTGNNNSLCFGCHDDPSGKFSGKTFFDRSTHGRLTKNISQIDTSTNAFETGDLTNVSVFLKDAATGDASLALPANIAAHNVNWVNLVNASASGNNLQKTSPQFLWNAGAVSGQEISSGNGYAEFTASSCGYYTHPGYESDYSHQAFGLTRSQSVKSLKDIDFGVYLKNQSVRIVEQGVERQYSGTFAIGDVFRVALENGSVKYYQNGAVIYTSSMTPVYPLRAGAAIWVPNETLQNAKIAMETADTASGARTSPTLTVPEETQSARVSWNAALPLAEDIVEITHTTQADFNGQKQDVAANSAGDLYLTNTTGNITKSENFADDQLEFPFTGNWYQTVFNGNNVYRSAAIGLNQSSSAKLTVKLAEAGNVSFRYALSSGLGDALVFYIDGNPIIYLYGEAYLNYYYTNIPLAPGVHELEWRYVSDMHSPEGMDTAVIKDLSVSGFGQAKASGTYTSPAVDISREATPDEVNLSWDAAVPTGTSLSVQSKVSLDGGSTWQDWQDVSNGGAIPGINKGANLTNARLQYRVFLSATDTATTPVLHSIAVSFTDYPQADITVQTNLSLDGGATWQGWQNVSDGGEIPGLVAGTDVSNARLMYRTTLYSENKRVLPELRDITIDFAIPSETSSAALTKWPGYIQGNSLCVNCHDPHGAAGYSDYLRAGGNNFCATCHDDNSVTLPANYSYRKIPAYDNSSHAGASYGSTSKGSCSLCHDVHGKDSGLGTPLPKQLIGVEENVCFNNGAGCHQDSANSAGKTNIPGRFGASQDPKSRHNITDAEQDAGRTKVECDNCHNPHLNSGSNKVADPDNRTANFDPGENELAKYVNAGGELYLLVQSYNYASLYTNAISLRIATSAETEFYNAASPNSNAWQSSGWNSPAPSNPGTEAGLPEAVATAANDAERWGTSLGGYYNNQLYRFKLKGSANSANNWLVSWTGYALGPGYNTSGLAVRIWNFTSSQWYQLDSVYNIIYYDGANESNINHYNSLNYSDFCNKCHDNNAPAGVVMGSDQNIAGAYGSDVHGTGSPNNWRYYLHNYWTYGVPPKYSGVATNLNVPYQSNTKLSCTECHDSHGSANIYHLRENVNGKTGVTVTDYNNNSQVLSFCQSCHKGTLNQFHSACLNCHNKPQANGFHVYQVLNAPLEPDFGEDCSSCHRHGYRFEPHPNPVGCSSGAQHCHTVDAAKGF